MHKSKSGAIFFYGVYVVYDVYVVYGVYVKSTPKPLTAGGTLLHLATMTQCRWRGRSGRGARAASGRWRCS